MSSVGLRLSAIFTLASYLVTSVHAFAGPCAAPIRTHIEATARLCAASTQPKETSPRCCHHCTCTHGVDAFPETEHGEHSSAHDEPTPVPTDHERDDRPCDDQCPCCP